MRPSAAVQVILNTFDADSASASLRQPFFPPRVADGASVICGSFSQWENKEPEPYEMSIHLVIRVYMCIFRAQKFSVIMTLSYILLCSDIIFFVSVFVAELSVSVSYFSHLSISQRVYFFVKSFYNLCFFG